MTVYKGSQKIKDIYIGSTKIAKIYKGSTLVYTSCPYQINQVIFENAVAGTYSLNLLTAGNYEVYVIAGGGGGARYIGSSLSDRSAGGGGSGSGFIGVVKLTKGVFSISVGSGGASKVNGTATAGGNSSIGSSIISYGGGGGTATRSSGKIGAGGGAPTVNVTQISATLNKAGNSGGSSNNSTSASGGASVYSGYGAGGSAGNAGTSGYVKIVYKG